jgi:hypothetical protein
MDDSPFDRLTLVYIHRFRTANQMTHAVAAEVLYKRNLWNVSLMLPVGTSVGTLPLDIMPSTTD